MVKRGIKVKELAKELGITSRELIERCRTSGVPVQNSVTKLQPEAERRVREWFHHNDENESADSSA
ncbi:MAG: translation initiation factor IF-2 N-terminal domain-containing protein [Planctomycetes bacterium]|nr:translation initiation factor IF-2 N-terminal domain-containing protein [Planctomycetota bacterium]